MSPTKPLRCAIYARVSTQDQQCRMQLDECRAYIERRGWILHAEYIDTGWSGSKADRPQLAKLMNAAKRHNFDCVIVWKLDRFGRSVANFVGHLQNLESWGVRFMCITQAIDTDNSNPASRLLMQILAAVAEFEREMTRERVKAGLAAARRRGVRLGPAFAVIDKVKVLELRLRGKSVRAIAAELGSTRNIVWRVLKDAA